MNTALYVGPAAWAKTYQKLVKQPTSTDDETKAILANFDHLIEWLGGFHLLTAITDEGTRACFVARLKRSEYALSDTALQTMPLFSCNCETFTTRCASTAW